MYTGDVKHNVEQYPTFVLMQENLAKSIVVNNLVIGEVFNDLTKLEEIAPFYELSEYININANIPINFPMLKQLNHIYTQNINPQEFYYHKDSSIGFLYNTFFYSEKNGKFYDKYITYEPIYNDKLTDNKIDDSVSNTNTTQLYELIRSNDAKHIIIVFKPNFKNSLKVRNELNNFILVCLEELRSVLSFKSNLTKYALFSKVTQL